MNRIKRIFIMIFLLVLAGASFLFFSYRTHNSIGKASKPTVIIINKGENFVDVAKNLKKENVISRPVYFIYYVWSEGLSGKIIAGEYDIPANMKIPEIVKILITGETKPGYVEVTFPEGWTMEQMSDRLTEKGLSGEEFLKLAKNPTNEIFSAFDFFKNRSPKASLEGYLFPDTYFFAFEASAQDIIMKMLKNFDSRFSNDLRNEMLAQDKDFFETITMASIVEGEVGKANDRNLVSGLFWKRLEIGMPLQSDVTVSYALGGEKKIQHDAKDIDIESPYNTYKYKGLPPGPVSNPGLAAIEAAINSTQSNYLYFLNNPKTGETFFSETFEEHVQKKATNGL